MVFMNFGDSGQKKLKFLLIFKNETIVAQSKPF